MPATVDVRHHASRLSLAAMSTSGGHKAIGAALVTEVVVAAALLVAFVVTGSSAVLAAAVHSVAAGAGVALLWVGGRRARSRAGVDHPFGYGRAHYFWAFVVAMVSCSLGSLFAIHRGIGEFGDADQLDSTGWALGIVLAAIVVRGSSLRVAVKEARPLKGDHRWRAYVRRARVPELPFVSVAGVAAIVGLVIASTTVALAQLSDEPAWDGIGAVAIGVVLAALTITSAVGMKSLLIGEGALPDQRDRMLAALGAAPEVERLVHVHTEYLGPDEMLVAAKVRFGTELTASELAEAIDRAEASIREAEPIARVIYLEPDLDDPEENEDDEDDEDDPDDDG